MKRIIIVLISFTFFCCTQSQNLLPEKWKFKTGDDPAYVSLSFNDSGWKEITPGTSWEKQGYAGYDGFAWYRVTFNVPSNLQDEAKKYGGFTLTLGKIDDVDFTYFNGEMIGNMGQLPPDYQTEWNVDRVYRIPAKKVLWDQPNTIAVRVFDLYGDGGLYSQSTSFSVRGISDFLTIEPVFSSPDRVLKGSRDVELSLKVVNGKKISLPGIAGYRVISDFGEDVFFYEEGVIIAGKSTTTLKFTVPGLTPGFYKVLFTFKSKLAFKEHSYNFGYEPEKIISPPDPRPDFDSFWDKARQELAGVDPRYKIMKIDTLCTSRRDVYLVEMYSLGDVLIRGWYSVPVVPGKYPAIMQVPGYTGNMRPEYVDYGDDYIGFGLNIRGHGNSQDDVNPGFPGFLFSGIEDKDTYIYRGAYMDCTRGLDFLFSRPEVDTTRVAVEGGSQGGALTFATAALNNTRIKVCAPQVPFLSDFQDYFKLATWPGNEFIEYVENGKKLTWDELYTTLSYFDIKNLAGWIKAPMIMGVGLIDDVCPPHTNFAAYNQVTSEKQYIVYPLSGHGLPEEFNVRKMEFIRYFFK